jgi:hypothetical protein
MQTVIKPFPNTQKLIRLCRIAAEKSALAMVFEYAGKRVDSPITVKN